LTFYYIKRNGRQRRRERRTIGRRHFACILILRSLVCKLDSLQWKVGAIHSHKFTHIMHTLLILSRMLCIYYSYARIRYAYLYTFIQYISRFFCLKHSPTAFNFQFEWQIAVVTTVFFHLTITTHHRDRGVSGVIKNAVFAVATVLARKINVRPILSFSARCINFKCTFKEVNITLKDNKIIFNLMQIV